MLHREKDSPPKIPYWSFFFPRQSRNLLAYSMIRPWTFLSRMYVHIIKHEWWMVVDVQSREKRMKQVSIWRILKWTFFSHFSRAFPERRFIVVHSTANNTASSWLVIDLTLKPCHNAFGTNKKRLAWVSPIFMCVHFQSMFILYLNKKIRKCQVSVSWRRPRKEA